MYATNIIGDFATTYIIVENTAYRELNPILRRGFETIGTTETLTLFALGSIPFLVFMVYLWQIAERMGLETQQVRTVVLTMVLTFGTIGLAVTTNNLYIILTTLL